MSFTVPPPDLLPADDVQGNAYPGFSQISQIVIGFKITQPNEFGEWLAEFANQLTTARAVAARRPGPYINIVFTCAGLGRLNVDLAGLDAAFAEGAFARVPVTGEGAATGWQLSDDERSSASVHGLILIAGDDREELISLASSIRSHFGGAVTAGFPGLFPSGSEPGGYFAHPTEVSRPREHFGFADALTNPRVPTDFGPDPVAGPAPPGLAASGAILDRGQLWLMPDSVLTSGRYAAEAAIVENGSLVVFRRYRQYVGRFRAAVAAGAVPDQAALMCGRSQSGVPIVTSTAAQARAIDLTGFNDFDYSGRDGVEVTDGGLVQVHNIADPAGRICPFDAHIRSVNPRSAADLSDRPRLFRRGIPYGRSPTDPRNVEVDVVDRGIHFIAYTASIVGSFEVLQGRMNRAVNGDALVNQKSPQIPTTFVELTGGLNGIALGINAVKLVTARARAI